MKKIYIDDVSVKRLVLEVIRQMALKNFKPDLVVGLVRGGSAPANLLSQYYDIPCYMVNKEQDVSIENIYSKIIVIDDINDSGKALTEFNNAIFDLNLSSKIHYATLLTNEGSSFEVDYYGKIINKIEDPCWVVFPWEDWWQK